jgi:invasion protein IalB
MKTRIATSRLTGGLAALGLISGLTAGTALAQQRPATQAPAQAAPAAQAPAAAQGAAAQNQSAWVKLCEKATLKRNEKEESLDICLTHHERLDGNTGMVIVSAALREVQGNPKKHLMVMVPLGVALPAGLQVKIDEEKEPLKLIYTLCHPGGCTAEIEATDAIIGKLKSGKQMVVAAMNVAAKPIYLPVPLNGFDQTLAGKPVDPQVYGKARAELMKQIYARQEELIKKAEEDAKKAPGAPAGATAAAPAPAGAAPAKASAAPAAAPAPAQKR